MTTDSTKPLTEQKCVPCEGGFPPLTHDEAEKMMHDVSEWSLSSDDKKISKEFKFKNFAEALTFVNGIGAIAESEGHHPDIALSWGRVGVALTTHAIDGLSVNDFILAAKISAIGEPASGGDKLVK